jgi:hypothetical protein
MPSCVSPSCTYFVLSFECQSRFIARKLADPKSGRIRAKIHAAATEQTVYRMSSKKATRPLHTTQRF